MSKYGWILGALTVCLVVQGCSPTEPDPVLEAYSRSVEEVIEQFTTAYNNQDMDEYADCLSDDFVFKVHLSECWGPSPSYPDSEWYLPTELLYTEALFAAPESISLEMETLSIEPYDPLTNSVAVECEFSLEVFTVTEPFYEGYKAIGNVEFQLEETSTDVWFIREWEDLSETKSKERVTWSRVKWIFYEE